jgi:hypothetical protein
MDWQHPMEWRGQWDRLSGTVKTQFLFKPLYDRSYADALAAFAANPDDYDGDEPRREDYMPDFGSDPLDRLGYCMYEEVSEGTPLSPVFETPEELARWLADHNASAMGGRTATYEQWLRVCRGGWAPTAVSDSAHGMRSGVEALSDKEKN